MSSWFGSSATPDPKVAAELESQIEMMDIVFRDAVRACSKACVPNYKDSELNKGESVCIKRCTKKFFTTLELVSQQLAEIGAQAAGQPSR